MSLLVVSTNLVDITKDFGKVVDITKLVNITKVVAISLLDRDGLRPSCELRRASKPVRFPFPLRGFKIVSFLKSNCQMSILQKILSGLEFMEVKTE